MTRLEKNGFEMSGSGTATVFDALGAGSPARLLRRGPSRSAAAMTRALVAAETPFAPASTRLTVEAGTPTSSATS
ncbi:hypothetical protein [Streptomyces sp. NPDC008139]|uniref:hypothetical protein n=1 Tax=Streptomyces sp. NPDC008139 TaxID=3364814 RepID=UPI0036E31E3D